MSSYLSESRILDVGRSVYSLASHSAAPNVQGGRPLKDSIESCLNITQAKNATNKSFLSKGRVDLPAPSGQQDKDELDILTAAFAKAFNSMHSSIITQAKDYVQLQQLDQTQTQAVLQSTTNALKKQQAAEQLAAQNKKYEDSMNGVQNILNDVMIAFGILLILGTFIAGAVTGGAADAAIPEEVEMVSMDVAEDVGSNVAEDVSTNVADSSADAGDGSDFEMDESVSSGGPDDVDTDVDSDTNSTEKNTDKTISRDLDKVEYEKAKFKLKWGNAIKVGKVLAKMTVGAALGSPMLMNYIVSQNITKQDTQLAVTQKEVGIAMNGMQRNNMYFQFLQQLVQREGNIFQNESDAASEVIDTYASILSAYRGISYGLAQAV